MMEDLKHRWEQIDEDDYLANAKDKLETIKEFYKYQ